MTASKNLMVTASRQPAHAPSTRRPTIYDVAQRAGVASSTVSRAFSNPSRLNAATVERVREVARELGFRPNKTARSLSTGKTGNVAMIAPSIANPFFAEFLRSFQFHAGERAFSVFFVDTHEDADLELESIRMFRQQTDGILLCAPRAEEQDLAQLTDTGAFVVFNHDLPGVPSVSVDSTRAIREALTDLARLGHTSCVYVAGPPHAISDQIRRSAARAVADELGLALEFTEPAKDDVEGAAAALDVIAATRASAVMAHSDLAAMNVLTEAQAAGLDVPADLSVIGHDDISFSGMLKPALSTIRTHIDRLGVLCADSLLDLIEARAAREVEDDPETLVPAAAVQLEADYTPRDTVGVVPTNRVAGRTAG